MLDVVKTVRFTGKNVFSPVPYWFTIRTETIISSSDRPSIDTTACSTDCFEKAARVITAQKTEIPDKKFIDATICDQCGKVVQIDELHPRFGGRNPLENWISSKSSSGKKDFCCEDCQRHHLANPEQSVTTRFRQEGRDWVERDLLKALASLDQENKIRAQEDRS